MKTLITLSIILALTGCANTKEYTNYLAAQAEANRLATESQKPLVRITAQPGQAITGLASLEVFMPVNAPVIQQQRPNEWVGVFGQGLSVIGTVMGIKYGGEAAANLADSVGKSSSAGYQFIQAPAASNTTTTTDASQRSYTGATSSITGSYNPVDTRTTTTLPPVTP